MSNVRAAIGTERTDEYFATLTNTKNVPKATSYKVQYFIRNRRFKLRSNAWRVVKKTGQIESKRST